jgi:dTDP-glucose 4,6-dehydratase
MPRKILVIGSNSFSGSDFIDLLLENPENEVVGISRSPEKSVLFLPYKRHLKSRFTFHQLDLNQDVNDIFSLLDSFKPEYVVNFAAQSEVAPSWKHPEQWFQTNAVALARLCNYLKDVSYLKRYVHISSPEVYGTCLGNVKEGQPINPSTPYAASKAAGDLFLFTLVKNYQFPMVMIRSTNVYGAHQQLHKIIPRSVIYIKSGRAIELHGGGHAVKSYIHIRDISRGEFAAMEKGKDGLIYHLSPDRGIAVKDLVRLIAAKLNVPFEKATKAVGERPGQDAAYLLDSTRARTELGWAPAILLEDGVNGVVDWIEKNWNEISRQSLEYIHQA